MNPFLKVYWQDLLVINYQVNPEFLDVLERYLPDGTELDDFNGRYYVSVVAFCFRKTRILGVPAPCYRDFPEINLRFYVRRKVNNSWRRGVVFIKEIIPHKLPAWIANTIFRENFHVHALKCEQEANVIRYSWDHDGQYQKIEVRCQDNLHDPDPGSLEEHIIEHYWAYKRVSQTKTAEFQVVHRPWRIAHCENTDIKLDIDHVYGRDWQQVLGGKPVSVFYADGSHVEVTRPQIIYPNKTMKIPENIQYIEVYYDGRCGMCCTFHEWINKQPRAFTVRFVPYQSPQAEEWFPGVNALEPEREMIVRADNGQLYRAAQGWVLCLLSCDNYQKVARRLASPVLLPFAEKVCHALAARRHKLSKVFFRKKDREVAEVLHRMPGQECDDKCRVGLHDNIPDGLI